MEFFSPQGITLILLGRSVIQSVRLFDVHRCVPFSFDGLKSPLLRKCFSDLNLYEAVTSSDLVVQYKRKFLLMMPTLEGMSEAQEVYIQLSLERY